jgi:hypothetical protein
MDMLRHDDISQHHETIPAAHPLQNPEQEITPHLAPEQRLPLKTAERDEVQITRAIKAVESLRHELESRENKYGVSVTREHGKDRGGHSQVSPMQRDLGHPATAAM